MKKLLLVSAFVASLAVLPAPARSEMAAGDAPPDFTGKEFINTEPCSFKSLRGHVVLVEIFRTW